MADTSSWSAPLPRALHSLTLCRGKPAGSGSTFRRSHQQASTRLRVEGHMFLRTLEKRVYATQDVVLAMHSHRWLCSLQASKAGSECYVAPDGDRSHTTSPRKPLDLRLKKRRRRDAERPFEVAHPGLVAAASATC